MSAAVCNGQVAPLPFPLATAPFWAGPSSHPTLLCHPFNCLSAASECTSMGTGTGTVSLRARVFQALDKDRLNGLINELVSTCLV